jgi:hypothetical protein
MRRKMMDWLEQELKQALERKEPSPGFAARVAAAARPATPVRKAWFAVPRWAAAAAALLVVSGGGLGYRHHEGMVAKEQVMQAMKITGAKLHRIQERVKEVSR